MGNTDRDFYKREKFRWIQKYNNDIKTGLWIYLRINGRL